MIGKFAALAVNDVVNVKSYYEGKCYSYLMYKDNDTLNIDLLNTIDTEYENGVEVEVLIKNAWSKNRNIIRGLQSLAYFEQIYVDSNVSWLKDYVNDFNNREIHEFDTFNVCSITDLEGINILMGNVLYKYDKAANLASFKGLDIAIKFNIGDLDVTPNRENIRYSNKTLEALNNRLKKVYDELNEILMQSLKKDFDSLYDVYKAFNQHYHYVTLYDFKDCHNNFYIDDTFIHQNNIQRNFTLNGEKLPENLMNYYRFIINCDIDQALLYNYYSRSFCAPRYIHLNDLYKKALILTEDPYKPLTKQYLRDEIFNDISTLIVRPSKLRHLFFDIFYSFKRCFVWKTDQHKENGYKCLRIIYDDICKQFEKAKTFNNSDVPADWIAVHKPVKITDNSKRRDLVLYKYVYNNRGDISMDTGNTLEDYIKGSSTVVYGEKGAEELKFMFKVLDAVDEKNVVFIGTAKSNILKLRAVDKFIPIETYLFKRNSYFTKIFTIKYAIDQELDINYNQRYDIQSKSYKEFVAKLSDYKRKFNRGNTILCTDTELKLYNDIYKYYVENNWIDSELIDDLKNNSYKAFSDLLTNVYNYDSAARSKIVLCCCMIKNKINLKDLSYKNMYKELINML